MTGWPSAAGSALAALVVLVTPGSAAATGVAAGERLDHDTLFRFADPSITESSGLVDAGSVVYTMNDSGAGPLLYAVDPRSGETTRTTTYSSSEVVDVEALAPAPDGDVWVADIGDNAAGRASVGLYRVRPGGGDAPRVELTYPDGPRDAETLLVHPVSGRAFVVSKSVFGGVVYAVPSLAPGGRTGCGGSRRCLGWSPTGRSSPTGSTCCCAATAARPSTPSRASRRRERSCSHPSGRGRASRSARTAGSC